jgi:formate hydrogenlyase subunit 6/NADH:ubiquinone oxidoreductase subunit I
MPIIDRKDFHQLFEVLKRRGFDIIGPTVQEQAIVYDHIDSVGDLPEGVGDEQEPGKYRLRKRADRALFGYVVGPTSWKRFLFPPVQKLWSAQRTDKNFKITPEDKPPRKMAFLGVRACELHAIAIQDKIFLEGSFVDPHYKSRRENACLIAVNCTQSAGTCFCVSMNTGPKATAGFDLSLTEVIDGNKHYFVADAGTPLGEDILKDIAHRGPQDGEVLRADDLINQTKANMQRSMDTANIKELLYDNLEHPQWEKVAQRCLSCANCTMACPTCFCSSVEDVNDLTGDHAQRWRKWDSCFTADFTYIHGGNIRSSTKSRYRQWMTHKLASWQDQFGMSGCVGCGRCIAWCPVGIDITEEAKIIRDSQSVQT